MTGIDVQVQNNLISDSVAYLIERGKDDTPANLDKNPLTGLFTRNAQ